MPSSISNSDRAAPGRRHSAVLLALLALYGAGSELTFRAGVPRVSQVERRVNEEYAAAVATEPRSRSAPTVLVLGNSLLGAGVRFDEVRRALLPGIDARRLLVEDTRYCDWYFGLRRLFAEGARPGSVVLVLSPGQLCGPPRVRGEYFAYHLMRAGDLPDVARAVGLGNTQASNLAFARVSAVFGLGAEVRKWALSCLLPDLPELMRLATRPASPSPPAGPLDDVATLRLGSLSRLTARHGSRLYVLIPPTPRADDPGTTAVQRAGRAAGVPVLVPVAPGSLPDDCFSDGFHLNARGAGTFTTRFAESLKSAIRREEVSAASRIDPRP